MLYLKKNLNPYQSNFRVVLRLALRGYRPAYNFRCIRMKRRACDLLTISHLSAAVIVIIKTLLQITMLLLSLPKLSDRRTRLEL